MSSTPVAQLEALHRIGQILHSELELEKIVQRVTDEATAICRAEFGAFFYNVIDRTGESYTLYTIAGVPRERFERFPMPRNTEVFAPTFRGEAVVRLDDVTRDPRYGKNAPYHGMPEGHLPVCSYLAVPVVARSGEVLGGLFFGHSRPAVFTATDEDAVVGIAGHAAIAIENARLYEAEKRARHAAEHARDRIERLQRVTVELSRAIGADEVVEIAIREIRELIGMQAAGVLRLDETGTRIASFTLGGETRASRDEIVGHIDLRSPSPIVDAIRTGELSWVVGADTIEERYPNLRALRGQVSALTWGAMPITFEGRTLGALGFSSTEERELGVEDRAFLIALGGQCGQAFERARLYDATLAARAEAEQASRAKDEFLAMLGHELRNPLSPILSAIQLMRLRGETSSAREQNMIERQVTHLIHLVDDLLDVARIARGKIELERKPQRLSALIAKAVEVVTPLIDERRHRLTVAVPDDELWLDADDVRIIQVVTNLLSNAAKYTRPGGAIHVGAMRDGAEVVVEVRDDGEGMPPELVPRVFDLFVQGYRPADRSQGGLGIGLSLVRKLVQMHGGSVSARSDGPGKGSVFAVRLPVLDTRRTAAATTETPRNTRVSVTARRLVLVDDNEDAVTLLADLLRTVGHDVRVAHEGTKGLELLDRFQPEIAILDIGLPGMDGYTLAAAIRERLGPRIKLIALTGYGQEQDRARADHAGFDAHFVKPVALAQLLAEIELPRR